MKTSWTIIPAVLFGLALFTEPVMLIPGSYFTGIGETEMSRLADATRESVSQVRDHVQRERIGREVEVANDGQSDYLFRVRRSGQFLVSSPSSSLNMEVTAIPAGSNRISRTTSTRAGAARLSLEKDALIYVQVRSGFRGAARTFEVTEPLRDASLDSRLKQVLAAGWEEWDFDPMALSLIEAGTPVNGNLAAGGALYYLVEADNATPFRVNLDSDEFDPYLEMWAVGEDGILASETDDDGGSGNNSMLRFRPTPGTSYMVIKARGYDEDDAGPFQLRVRAPRPRAGGWTVAEVAAEEGLELNAVRNASAGSRITGYLDAGQEIFYQFEMTSEAEIDLTSDDFDTYVEAWVVDTSGGFFSAEETDDDGGGNQDSHLEMDMGSNSVLLVKVRGYSDSGEGTFQLFVR